MRSVWKIPMKIFKKNKYNFIYHRGKSICEFFINKKVFVHNGKKFVDLIVTKEMLEHKFGEFCLTKKQGVAIHSENKVNVKKRKKMILQKNKKTAKPNKQNSKKKVVKNKKT